MKKHALLLMALGLIFLGKLHAQSSLSEQELTNFTTQFEKAYNQKDYVALQKMYTNDAVIILQNGESVSGGEQVSNYFSGQFKAIQATMQIKVSATKWSDAEHAFVAIGTYQITGKTIADSKEVNALGVYANTMIKQENEWKIAKTVLTAPK